MFSSTTNNQHKESLKHHLPPLSTVDSLLSSQEKESSILVVQQVVASHFDNFSVIKMVPPMGTIHWNQGTCGPMPVIVSISLSATQRR